MKSKGDRAMTIHPHLSLPKLASLTLISLTVALPCHLLQANSLLAEQVA